MNSESPFRTRMGIAAFYDRRPRSTASAFPGSWSSSMQVMSGAVTEIGAAMGQIPKATQRFELAQEAVSRRYDKEAAFDLHQVTESLYHCVLLVLTLYSPKLHRLNRLRPRAEGVEARLIAAWPRDTRFARRCFARLDRAYVDARYSPHYEITGEELAGLVERIRALREIVATICAEKLGGHS